MAKHLGKLFSCMIMAIAGFATVENKLSAVKATPSSNYALMKLKFLKATWQIVCMNWPVLTEYQVACRHE